MTRTEKLAKKIKVAYLAHKQEIDHSIVELGPRGGHNCMSRPGWSHSPNGTITRACTLAGVPVGNWWAGSAPTPASAIPTLLLDVAIKSYDSIFGEVE